MSTLRHPVSLLGRFALIGGLFAAPAYADQLVYVPLSQPCRLLDTRASTGGPGPLKAASGAYLFGTSNADISSVAQHGNTSGCAIPAGIEAVSVNMNMLDASLPGNIATWSAEVGPAAPNIGTGVYNPSTVSPAAGQVLYNTGYSTIPVGTSDTKRGRFYLQVANGTINMTMNVVGYWRPISWGEAASSNINAVAFGAGTTSSGNVSTAMGSSTTASGDFSTAIGSNVSTSGHTGSFIYGDAGHTGIVANTSNNQFTVVTYGGVQFFTGEDPVSHALAHGVELPPGGGSWTSISDRNAKTAVQSVDAREVLKKVAALPLNTWQYKTQDPKYRHMGPMAQDFYAAFKLGETDKGIDTVDADGVALAAIQGLNELLTEKDAKTAARLDEKEREIAALHEELSAQKAEGAAQKETIAAQWEEIQGQKSRLASLESLAGEFAEMKSQLAALRRSSSSTHRVHVAAVENDCCSEGRGCRVP